MHFLRLFGGAAIEVADGSPLPSGLGQRHRLALFALLAVESQGLSRDKLIAYLWPESDTKRSRNLLNVSVYVVRTSLGEDVVVSRGDDLRLNLEEIRVDAVEFVAAVDRGDYASAVSLYRGPFLDGFFLSGAKEFELWADVQRDRFADMYANALESLACAAEAAGDAQGAVEWWKRRVAHDRFDSRVVVRLMQALDSIGNRAGALELADIHAELLRQEFGTGPAAEVITLAERIRAAPDIPTVQPEMADERAVTAAAPPRTPAAPAEPDPSPGSPPPSEQPAARPVSDRRRPAWHVIAGALVGIGALSLTLWAAWPEADVPHGSIAVLPFVNLSPEADNEFFADGVTEEIIAHMSAVPELKVISRTSVMRYKESERSLLEIADELDVAHILEGTVRRVDGQVRISAQLIDAATDHHLWSSTFDGGLVDIFGLQERIARDVVRALEAELLTRGDVSPARRGTRDPEALDLFLRGRYQWTLRTPEGHERARDYFTRAIERDSAYSDAYAGLAHTHLTSYQLGFTRKPEADVYSEIKWAAERALALDESSADAHVALATALWWQWNWPGAERELLRALEFNPGHVTARTWYALLLVGWGRLDEALREIRRANELDPFAVVTSGNYAFVLYHMRRYDEAIEQWWKTVDLGGPIWMTRSGLGMSYALSGNREQAVRVLREAAREHPDRPGLLADLAYALASAGDRDEARALLARARELGAGPFGVGTVYVALEEHDSAFAALGRSPWQWPHRASRSDPALDPFRLDPRFVELSSRVERDLGIGPAR